MDSESGSDISSSEDGRPEGESSRCAQAGARKAFSEKQVATLKSHYKSGMMGVGRQYSGSIEAAAKETGLKVSQVKGWIKRTSFRKRHAIGDVESTSGPVKQMKLTPWQLYQKKFATSKAGAAAMQQAPAAFMKAASESYNKLGEAERSNLQVEAKASLKEHPLSRKGVINQGGRVFKSMQPKFQQLEDLGYHAFAFGFHGDSVQLVGTSTALKCCSPQLLEYLHATIVAGNPPPVCNENTAMSLEAEDKMVPMYKHAVGSSNSNTEGGLMSGAAVDGGVDGKGEDDGNGGFHSGGIGGYEIGSKVGSVSESSGRVESGGRDDSGENNESGDIVDSDGENEESGGRVDSSGNDESGGCVDSIGSGDGGVKDGRRVECSGVDGGDSDTGGVSDSGLTTWIKDPYLSFQDKHLIDTPGCWLNDGVINAAQLILKHQSGEKLCGFQNTQYGKGYRFQCVTGKFVQVLNVNKSHWVTVSNVDCETDTVDIYDSAYSWLSLDSKKQICSLVRPSSKSLQIRMVNIQRQGNSSDCGLFALASATSLVNGRDPFLSYWDKTQMRSHLVSCFENSLMSCFPEKSRRIPVRKKFKKIVVEKVYCKCRLPNDKSIAMIQCDRCHQWYHKSCVDLEDKSMNEEEWVCDQKSCIRK